MSLMFSYQCIDKSEMTDPAQASLAHTDLLSPSHPISIALTSSQSLLWCVCERETVCVCCVCVCV